MSDLESTDWSELAANNIQPAPAGWPSLSSPNIVYSTDREMMGAIKRDWNRINPTVTSGGSGNAQTLTYTSAPAAYIRGQRYAFVAGFTNTGATTLNVNGLGVKNVLLNGASLLGGEITATLVVEVVYDGVSFALLSGNSFVPLTGGSMTGPLIINGSAGTSRNIRGQTSGLSRWQLQIGNSTAESGSPVNTGSDFEIDRYTDAGAFIDAPLTINRASGAVSERGTQTNDAAPAGYVGELIQANITSPVTLTSNTVANVGSISLTAGDWDVSGEVWIAVGTGGSSGVSAGIGSTSATLPAGPGNNSSRNSINATLSASNTLVLPLRTCRVPLASPATYYLLGYSFFGSGTTTVTGNISARRAR